MKKEYKVITATGDSESVQAESRSDAIKLFCERHGMPKDFFERNCKIKIKGA